MVIDQTEHGWMYNHQHKLWVMVRCSCDETSPRCPALKNKRRGEVKGRRVKATDNDRLLMDIKVFELEDQIANRTVCKL